MYRLLHGRVHDFAAGGHGAAGRDYGDAVRSGIACARGRFVVFLDAGHSHDPAFIRDLFARRNEADVVVASRYVPGGDTENVRLKAGTIRDVRSGGR